MKPVRSRELLEAMLIVSGKLDPTERPDRDLITCSHRETTHPLDVLIAEDDLVNRELVTRLLEKRGHRVVTVSDGNKILDVLKKRNQKVDVVLMDVEMPGKNGIEATTAVRMWEKQSEKRLPIVAMTAHAEAEDRERCLEAGMDAYISKPVSGQRLFEVLEAMVPRMSPCPDSDLRSSALDRVDALDRVAGDKRLLAQLARIFLEGWRGRLNTIHHGLERSDANMLVNSAHTLKGALGSLAAHAASQAAADLEAQALRGNFVRCAAAAKTLEQEIDRIVPVLAELSEDIDH